MRSQNIFSFLHKPYSSIICQDRDTRICPLINNGLIGLFFIKKKNNMRTISRRGKKNEFTLKCSEFLSIEKGPEIIYFILPILML